MTNAGVGPLQFKPLADDLWRGAFCCGVSEIDDWFRKRALDEHQKRRCRVTTVHNEENLLVGLYAYCISVQDERTLERANNIKRHVVNRCFPSLEVHYIAVSKECQGIGIGTIIMGRIVDTFLDAADRLGVPVMTLIALNERAAKLYEKMGFQRYGTSSPLRMMLPAQSVLDLNRAKVGGI